MCYVTALLSVWVLNAMHCDSINNKQHFKCKVPLNYQNYHQWSISDYALFTLHVKLTMQLWPGGRGL